MVAHPRHLDAGEAALVVELGKAVDPAVNNTVVITERRGQRRA